MSQKSTTRSAVGKAKQTDASEAILALASDWEKQASEGLKALRKLKKAKKPKQDKPPFLHKSGRWAKKVNGQFAYLGSALEDPTGERAQRIWNEQCHGIRAGRKPIIDATAPPEGVTVKVLIDTFLSAKKAKLKTGEMAQRSFDDLHRTCLKVADTLTRHRLVSDLTTADFAYLRGVLADGRGLVTLQGEIRRVRNVFNWGFRDGMLENAVRFGDSFNPPAADKLRIQRSEKPAKLFQQPELRKILEKCGVQVKAMVLLGINAGLGNSDCARLKLRHLDLKTGWLDFPRPKTGEARRAKLWSESVQAIKAAIAERPEPKDKAAHGDLVFVTKYGRPWREDSNRNNPLSHEFAKVLDELGMRQPGVNFYSLRHTLQTVGEESRDEAALRRIMGHVAHSFDMSATYREKIEDARLVAVSEYVRAWLFPPEKKAKKKPR